MIAPECSLRDDRLCTSVLVGASFCSCRGDGELYCRVRPSTGSDAISREGLFAPGRCSYFLKWGVTRDPRGLVGRRASCGFALPLCVALSTLLGLDACVSDVEVSPTITQQ